MKNLKAIAVGLLILIAFQSEAQLKRFEILAGPSLSSIRSDIEFFGESFRAKLAYAGGVGLTFGLNEHLVLNTQLLYENKGARTREFTVRDNSNVNLGNTELKWKLHTISLPVTVGYEFGDKVKMQIYGGGYVGYFVSQTQEGISFDSDEIAKIDFGATAGFTAYLPIQENLDFKIGLQHSIGFANIYNVPEGDAWMGDYYMKTRSSPLLFGLSFKL